MGEYYFHLDQLTVGYNGKPLIDRIQVGIHKGEIVTLIGPNGSGKSTILKSITRQLKILGGKVLYEQNDLHKLSYKELSTRMAVVLTERMRPELMTCHDIVATGRYPYTGRLGILSRKDEDKVDEAMKIVHAEELGSRDFNAISDGQRQRVLLARAICQEPEIIVLDEPTSFLDIRHKLELLSILRSMAKEKGITTMAIVNVVGSSIAREADKVFYTLAGPEISVATTKAYSAQLAAMYCLAVQFAKVRGKITEEQYSYYISELLTLPEKMQKALEDKERIQWFAAKYANAHDVFFVGRGIDYAVCLEGSLKLKEISYIHSEAYAAGELKHGTISLIEQGTLVIGVLTQSELYEKTISNMLECKSRGAYLMGLTTYGKYEIEDQVNFTVYVPKVDEHFVGSLAVIPLQLLGYYVSVAKGLDVDKPRNLAKSVTVE